MSTTATRTPSAASVRAITLPMPPPPPSTRAVLSFSCRSIFFPCEKPVSRLLLRADRTVSGFRDSIDFDTHAIERASDGGSYGGGTAHHFGVHGVETLKFADVGQIRLDANKPPEISARIFQNKAQIVEHRGRLLFDRVAENVSLRISRDLTRHKNQTARAT